MDCPPGTIGLLYTLDEWAALEQMAQQMEGVEFRAFLHRRIIKLGRMSDNLEYANDSQRQQKKFIIPEGTSCQLLSLSRRFDIPLATLIARFIVSPLLRDHYESGLSDFIEK